MKDRRRSPDWLARVGITALSVVLMVFLAACGGADRTTTAPVGPNEIPENPETAEFRVDESAMTAAVEGSDLVVTLPVTSKVAHDLAISGQLRLVSLDGVSFGSDQSGIEDLRQESETVLTFFVPLDELSLSGGRAMSYVLKYSVEGSPSVRARGARSLYEALDHDQFYLLSSDTWFAGSDAVVRLLAHDAETREVLANRPAVVILTPEEGDPIRVEGRTDEIGSLALEVAVPEDATGMLAMSAQVDGRSGTVEMEGSVNIRRESRILVTTDKPFYQPGQKIHIRTLSMKRPSLTPMADSTITYEVQDPKGNWISREEATTDEFGVSSTVFKLANELNMGSYRIFATVGDTTSERTVTVERYALPKFKVQLESDQTFYRPGDAVHGTIRSDYFFGKPVAGGDVNIVAYKFDLEFEEFAQINGTLDENGVWDFDFALPTFFVGQPLEQGNAFVRLDVSVTDTAGHNQTMTRTLAVAASDILVQAIPATAIVPGTNLGVFVLVAQPDGSPFATTGEATMAGLFEPIAFETDARGLAKVVLPSIAPDVTISLSVVGPSGDLVQKDFQLGFATEDSHALSVSSDKSIYTAGDLATLTLRATPAIQRVFVDGLKDNQIILTTATDISGGVGSVQMELPTDLTGNVQFDAYAVAPDGNIIRAHALVFVEAARDLTLSVVPEQETYLPGESAVLDIRVTDADGDGVASSVGLTIVDEAVFAIQDFRPGMEKVYFQLEKEILEPRYEIHGHSAEDVLRGDDDASMAERDQVAELVFAASKGMSTYGIAVDSFVAEDAVAGQLANAAQASDAQLINEALHLALQQDSEESAVAEWVDSHSEWFIDPWGQPYNLTSDYYNLAIHGYGPDELAGTEDDYRTTFNFYYNPGDELWAGAGNNDDWDGDAVPEANGEDRDGAMDPTDSASGGGGDDAPRVRSYFPETMYVNPSIITDGAGEAQVQVPLADSITTWRMTGVASSLDGGLGSSLDGLRVFQDFFVDINFPAVLTAADEVRVPIALYNYLETEQTVSLRVDSTEDVWYELLDGATRELTLAPGEVVGDYFTVKVTKPGWHDFQVTAIGDLMSDAVRRRVQVIPDGQEQFIDASSKLDGTVAHQVQYPPTAIDGALSLLVKVYPGFVSQAIDGLDGLLRSPSGCFEQTSSTTYPNVLVLNYLRETEQTSPEVELKALEYINLGYQRLLTFEVDGGGFEWFGNDPAHRILTAYGLLEFSDMSKVAFVDPAIITRTQAWLISVQEADGSWNAAPEGIHEGATNNFTDSNVRATAYIVYSLVESGYDGPEVASALQFIRSHTSGVDDAYSKALMANALLGANSTDATGLQLVAELDAMKETNSEEGTAWWTSDSSSFTYGSGKSMVIETTAYALMALSKAGGYSSTLDMGTAWLIMQKDGFGSWENTQATILTLRFLLGNTGGRQEADATVGVYHDDVLVETIAIDNDNSDILRQIDLGDRVHGGTNDVRLEFAGTGNFTYQVAGRYYVPWVEVPLEPTGPLTIDVSYDKTTLESDEYATASVTVANTSDARVDMVLVDLGVPPGFDVVTTDFDVYMGDETSVISRVDTTGRQVIVYLYGINANSEVAFEYRLRAGEPLRAQSPPSQAYLYYDTDQKAESAPEAFEVTEAL